MRFSHALRLALAGLVPVGLAASPLPASAAENTVCKARGELIELLATKFGETQQSFGLQSDTKVLEVYASASGSWTALLTLPNGKSCVVASGQAWTTMPPAPIGSPV